MTIEGGNNIYGIPVGVLSLESSFPKLPGRIKNATTFDFPVTYKVVRGATTQQLIAEQDRSLLDPFIEAARELEREGVLAITGSCGFLVLFQRELAESVSVPVFASSLVQVPMVHAMMGHGRKVGIMTAAKSSLGPEHLRAVGADGTTVCIAGMDEQPEFCEVILEARRSAMDFARLEAEILTVAEGLVRDNPDTGAIVLECTDMSSFAHSIQQKVQLPIFDLTTLTNMVYDCVVRTTYSSLGPRLAAQGHGHPR